MKATGLLVAIRIRGESRLRTTIADTMDSLHLHHKNYCVLIPVSESMMGMVSKIQDYITFGEIDRATLVELLKIRGRLAANKKVTEEYLKKTANTTFEGLADDLLSGAKKLKDIPGLKPFFRLSPPVKGFERGGIKHPFSTGGVLGYRRDAINALIRRML